MRLRLKGNSESCFTPRRRPEVVDGVHDFPAPVGLSTVDASTDQAGAAHVVQVPSAVLAADAGVPAVLFVPAEPIGNCRSREPATARIKDTVDHDHEQWR